MGSGTDTLLIMVTKCTDKIKYDFFMLNVSCIYFKGDTTGAMAYHGPSGY